jgi:hypothetical protein
MNDKNYVNAIRTILVFCSFCVFTLVPLAAEKEYKLSDALTQVAEELTVKLPVNSKVVVVGITCDDPVVGEVLAEDLTYELMQTGKVIMVDRTNIDLIRKELAFQLSGEVSDDSSQRIGAMLGAETLVTGSFEKRGNNYRFSLKAVHIETAEIQYFTRLSVDSNTETESLYNRKTGSEKAVEVATNGAKKAIGFTGRLLAMSVNPFFGIGSFIQGDTTGGKRVAFWEVAGIGSLIYGSNKMDTDSEKGAFWTAAGGLMFGGAAIYSWVRPWIYNRDPALTHVIDNFRVVPVIASSSPSDTTQSLVGFRAVYSLTY